jgi:hypothetical protein
MRKTITLGDLSFDVLASFGAARELAQKVADPLHIAREAQLEAMLGETGQVYHPRFMLTVENVPLILHIGAKAAGDKVTLGEVQEACFTAGLLAAKMAATDYLAMLIQGGSQEAESKGDTKAGE